MNFGRDAANYKLLFFGLPTFIDEIKGAIPIFSWSRG